MNVNKFLCSTLVLLLLLHAPVALALEWATSFVVWDGKVYTIHEQTVISAAQIEKQIGKVKRKVNDQTGRYFGDAANIIDKGTPYFAIKTVPVNVGIAVKLEERYVFAEYSRKAPFHIMTMLSNQYFWVAIIALAFTINRLHKKSLTSR